MSRLEERYWKWKNSYWERKQASLLTEQKIIQLKLAFINVRAQYLAGAEDVLEHLCTLAEELYSYGESRAADEDDELAFEIDIYMWTKHGTPELVEGLKARYYPERKEVHTNGRTNVHKHE